MRKSIALSVLGWLLAFGPAQAQVAFDATVTASTHSTGTVATLSNANLTVGTGSNRVLIAQMQSGLPVGCTWDAGGSNQAMTQIISYSPVTGYYLTLWGLVNPVSGNKTLTCTFTAQSFVALAAVSFTGADQTGGATTFYNSGNNTGSSTTPTITISSAAGDAAVDLLSPTNTISAPTQTQTFFDNIIDLAGSRAAGAPSVTFSWTQSPTGAWFEIATAVKAAAPVNHNLLLIGVGQ